jgi:hypothetical protein
MLTKADDFPIHQTPEPIAYSGSDRNFYDRYFFNGYSPDGQVFFAAALGVYPHLNIMDASFCVIIDGIQHAVHASKVLHMERLDLNVGPITIEVVKPLEVLRVKVDDKENGIKADLTFTLRCQPLEEPRFQFRNGPRMFMDYTRLTQNGTWAGSMSVQGKDIAVTPEFVGTRDRSWGIRPVGAGDAQPQVPERAPQFYWIWIPLNFENHVSFYHINARADGSPWNESAVVTALSDDGLSEHTRMASCRSKLHFKSGTRHAKQTEVWMSDASGGESHLDLQVDYNFQMAGLGYTHPEWGHGHYKGELAVGYETYDLANLDENEFHHLHVQAMSKAVLTLPDGSKHEGRGIVEQLIMGPHEPSGFTEMMDFAP